MLTGMSLETTKRREIALVEKKAALTLKSTAAHRNFDDDASESLIGRVSEAILELGKKSI